MDPGPRGPGPCLRAGRAAAAGRADELPGGCARVSWRNAVSCQLSVISYIYLYGRWVGQLVLVLVLVSVPVQ